MDSAFEVHNAGALGAAAALARPPKLVGWPTAPLPLGGGSTPPQSRALEEELAQHMLLLDFEEGDDDEGDTFDDGPPAAPNQAPASPAEPATPAAAAAVTAAAPPLPPPPPPQQQQQQQQQQRRKGQGPVTPSGFTPAEAYIDRQERTVFFAKCAPSAPADAVARVFAAYGEVEEINVFRSWPSAKASRGCGLVVMATPEGAAAAIEGLHHKYTWDGVATPMVVERCCASRLGVKAATQSATRARRTAAASAARRGARAGAAWHAVFGGGIGPAAAAAGPRHSCPIAGLALPPGTAIAPAQGGPPGLQAGQLLGGSASTPLAVLPSLSLQQQYALQQQAAEQQAAAAAAAVAQQQTSARLQNAVGMMSSPDEVRSAYSAPLPMVRRPSMGFGAAGGAGSPPAYGGAGLFACASSGGGYPSTSPPPAAAAPGGLTLLAASAASIGQAPMSQAALELPLAGLSMPMGGLNGVAVLPAGAAQVLQQAAPGAGADGGAPPCCPLSLQSAEQVQMVLEHANTLSALSGASIWLKPEPGAAPGTGLALSGTPAQLQAAASLIGQLLTVAATGTPAVAAPRGWR